jgi:protein-tyrosine phosphatase
VLFLCTGNYYRSRFAEELWNHHARRNNLREQASSKGFKPDPEINPGAMSKFSLERLTARGITPARAACLPAAVTRADFLRYRIIIALSQSEHRPMLLGQFPEFLGAVRFWQVEDVQLECSTSALDKIEVCVRHLLEELSPD